jgi:hypothetical protein
LGSILIRSPGIRNPVGIGAITNATKPKTLLPQPRPTLSYSFSANSGKVAPERLRNTVLAVVALAAWIVNALTRYVWMHIKIAIMPNPIVAFII